MAIPRVARAFPCAFLPHRILCCLLQSLASLQHQQFCFSTFWLPNWTAPWSHHIFSNLLLKQFLGCVFVGLDDPSLRPESPTQVHMFTSTRTCWAMQSWRGPLSTISGCIQMTVAQNHVLKKWDGLRTSVMLDDCFFAWNCEEQVICCRYSFQNGMWLKSPHRRVFFLCVCMSNTFILTVPWWLPWIQSPID